MDWQHTDYFASKRSCMYCAVTIRRPPQITDQHCFAAGVCLGSGTVMPATLVIDASGRYSSLPLWLEEGNWGRPAVKKVDAQLCYTSCTVQLPEQPVVLVSPLGI